MPDLARYMATSAHQTRPALSVASVGAMAMPMLALMRALTTSSTKGSSRLCGEPLGDRRGVVGVPVDEHDGELVATEADEQIGVAQRAR